MRLSPFFRFCLACTFILLSEAADAQTKPWSFSSNNSFYFFEGNTDKFDFYSDTQFSRADSNYELSASYKFAYGELDGVKNNLEHRGGIKYDYRHLNDLSPFAALNVLHNPIRAFDLRATALAGVKYRYLQTETSDFSISAAIMYEHANFASPADPGIPEKPNDNIARLSVRPKFKVEAGRFKFSNVTFYQPLLNEFADYLLESSTTIGINVVDHLDFTINYILWYNSRPAYEAILKRDQQLVFGIKVYF